MGKDDEATLYFSTPSHTPCLIIANMAATEEVRMDQDIVRGSTRGGLGAIAPYSEHASPPSKGEKRFFRRFLAFIVP